MNTEIFIARNYGALYKIILLKEMRNILLVK